MASEYEFVESLPDLITEADYPGQVDGRLVRLRVTASADGVEVLGDALRPAVLENLLRDLGDGTIQQMLCG